MDILMHYNAIIVEQACQKIPSISDMVENWKTEIKILDTADSTKQAYACINHYKPDLVILKICKETETGFEIMEANHHVDFEVIVIADSKEYALEAIQYKVVDYLVYPFEQAEFSKAVERAKKKIETNNKLQHYEILKEHMEADGDQETKITIPADKAYDFVKVANIVRCEGWQKYTKVYLTNGEAILSSYNIGMFKTMLEHLNFYSCHRSHIVNRKLIRKYLKEGTIIMFDGSEIPVAKRKRDEFQNLFIKLGHV